MSKKSKTYLSLFSSVILSACGVQVAPVVTSSQPEIRQQDSAIHEGYRLTATDPLRKSLVYLMACRDEHTCASCTGTLVSKNQVLTAAHCATGVNKAWIQGYGDDFETEGAATRAGNTIQQGVTKIQSPVTGLAQQVELDNKYLTTNQDLALLTLTEDAPEGSVALPIATPEVLAAAKTWSFRVMGYGLDENGNSGVLKACDIPGNMAAVHAKFTTTDKDPGFSYFCTNGQLDHGDSGGPLLATLDGTTYVLGVNHIIRTVRDTDGSPRVLNVSTNLLAVDAQAWLKTITINR